MVPRCCCSCLISTFLRSRNRMWNSSTLPWAIYAVQYSMSLSQEPTTGRSCSSDRIRQRWPAVRLLLRADAGFAREALMAWCEDNAVDFLFGLARNSRLVDAIKAELAEAAEQSQQTGKSARRFKSLPPRRRGTSPGRRAT